MLDQIDHRVKQLLLIEILADKRIELAVLRETRFAEVGEINKVGLAEHFSG